MTGVPAQVIRELAHAYARADRAILCWTLGITEHVTAVDNVLSLINLALLTGPRRALRLGPEPAARAEQRPGRRRHGRDPQQAARLPGRAGRLRRAPASRPPGAPRSRPSAAGTCRRCSTAWSAASCNTLYVLGENPAQSEADSKRALGPARGARLHDRPGHPDDRRRARWPTSCCPSSASWCESEGGTVTNSERRVQLMRKAIDPPGEARDDQWIICELARAGSATTGASRRPSRCGTSCAR